MKRVTDIININDIESWAQGDIITIKAGTGSGKSYFIKNTLYDYAKEHNKKILMLVHRSNCEEQFKREIEEDQKTDVITIQTYQSIEHLKKNNVNNNLLYKFDYIVCDEFHYFFDDSTFNHTTDLSMENILSQNYKIRIFMSATGDAITGYFKKYRKLTTIDYKLPISHDNIDNLIFFNKDENLYEFVELAIKNNKKTIFFIESAEKAYDLHSQFKNYSLFNCSKGNPRFYKHVKKKKISEMLINERFEELILITTTCMDAGVNIIDPDLNHIVCDVKDIDTLIQCIGRKRSINEDDKFNLLIKHINNKQLGGLETKIKKRYKKAEYLKENGTENYINKYGRHKDSTCITYDSFEDGKAIKKVNELMYFKCILDLARIEFLKTKKGSRYKSYISNLLGIEGLIWEEKLKMDDLKVYIDNLVGSHLSNENKKELITKIGIKDSRGRLLKSLEILNAYFNENKMGYMIISKRSSKRVDGKPKTFTYWEIINNVDTK